jgi:hypothetical protein
LASAGFFCTGFDSVWMKRDGHLSGFAVEYNLLDEQLDDSDLLANDK